MRRSLPIALCIAALALSCRKDDAPGRTVPTAVRDTRGAAATALGHDIELRGVVTCFDATAGVLYLQDDTGAQAFLVGNLGAPLVAGQEAVLVGRLETGGALARLSRPRITVLGQAEMLPQVRPISLAALVARDAESEWVQVQAVVQGMERRGDQVLLDIQEGGTTARAMIAAFGDPEYPALTGARVRLGGTSSARAHAARMALPVDLFVPSLQDVRIMADPPASAATPGTAAAPVPPITTASGVRMLSSAEAAKHLPVHLHAIVTFNDPEQGLFFVQDESGGLYVEAWRHIHPVRPGDRVEIEGVTGAGAFAPIIDRPRVRWLAHGDPPPARHVRAGHLLTGAEDSQWVEVEGVVRNVKFDRYGALIRVADGPLRLTVQIPAEFDAKRTEPLLNARVRVRGACRSMLTVGNQLADVMLHSPDVGAITVVAAPPPDRVVRPVSSLLQFGPGVAQDWEHRVTVAGAVTYSQPGEIYLEDETGSVFVHSLGRARPALGDMVEASGFAAAGDYKPVLEDAEVRTVRPGVAPAPVVVSPEQVLSGRFDTTLVTLEGRLLDSVRGADGQRLLMRAGPYVFTATLPQPLEDLRPGSELRLTGVCTLATGERRSPQNFRLRLRSAADVVVQRRAPWWNPRQAAWMLGATALVAGLSLAWVTTLRRRVRAQSAVIWDRVKRETELQERQRMARELHDTLQQNLAGIGLCLAAVNRALPNRPADAQRHLAVAIDQVDVGVDAVQRSVWALRTASLESSGLTAALDEMGQQLARCSSTPIEVRTLTTGEPRTFAASTEGHLLRIGQEAMTNAVQHGHASHIEVELRYEADAFRLRVSDDGLGFDVERPARAGHFGLVGMRERAAMMGATIEVKSAMDEGTHVQVTLPLPPRRYPAQEERRA
jgi:signal transduction histidine kinase